MWLEDLDRAKYVLLLAKLIPQRPEHIGARIKRFPSMYPLKFYHLKKFDKIPEHFMDVFHAMLRLGIDVDGTPYGTYALTVQGKGKGVGHFKAGAKLPTIRTAYRYTMWRSRIDFFLICYQQRRM